MKFKSIIKRDKQQKWENYFQKRQKTIQLCSIMENDIFDNTDDDKKLNQEEKEKDDNIKYNNYKKDIELVNISKNKKIELKYNSSRENLMININKNLTDGI